MNKFTQQQKEELFIDWLCGKKVPFPFFRDLPEVPLPDICKEKTIVEITNEECEEYFGAYDKFCEMEENKI